MRLGRALVSMHLLVLSAFRRSGEAYHESLWEFVSMHLLVLSAFRLIKRKHINLTKQRSLNAPFGAQCFPTHSPKDSPSWDDLRLNAPFGAQCFPTLYTESIPNIFKVSMHLLVLSAFRR